MLFFLIQHCKVKGARRVLCNTFLVRTLSLFLALSIEEWFLAFCYCVSWSLELMLMNFWRTQNLDLVL